MLFLFNDVVFDLGDLTTLLRDGTLPLPPAQFETLQPAHLTALVREAVFVDPNIARNKFEQCQHLCALIAYRAPGANALLAVRYEQATGPEDVGLRFANVPITTLAYLWKRQNENALTAHEINGEVWTRVTDTLHSAH